MNSFTHLEKQLDEIIVSLYQVDALLTVVMDADITELPPVTIQHYLWATSNIINSAKLLCEKFPRGQSPSNLLIE